MHDSQYEAVLLHLQVLVWNEERKKWTYYCTLDFYIFAKNGEM